MNILTTDEKQTDLKFSIIYYLAFLFHIILFIQSIANFRKILDLVIPIWRASRGSERQKYTFILELLNTNKDE